MFLTKKEFRSRAILDLHKIVTGDRWKKVGGGRPPCWRFD